MLMRKTAVKTIICAAAAVLILSAPSGQQGAVAEQDCIAILKRAINQNADVDLAGVQKVLHFGLAKTRYEKWLLRRAHGGKLRTEILAPPQRKGVLVVNDGRIRYEYFPRLRLVRYHPVAPPAVTRRRRLNALSLLQRNFRIIYAGKERIMDRWAHVVVVKRPNGRIARRVYVDTQKFVELKIDEFAPSGRPISSRFFVDITFSPVFGPSDFVWVHPSGVRKQLTLYLGEGMTLAEAQARVGYKPRLPTVLPPGFQFLADDVTVPEVEGQKVLWLRFSNGLDTFSLFERLAGPGIARRLPAGTVTWNANGMNFTLVGSLTPEEFRRIKASIK